MRDESVLFDRASRPMRPELMTRLEEMHAALCDEPHNPQDGPRGDNTAAMAVLLLDHRRSRRRRHTWLILAAGLVFVVTSVALFSRSSDIDGEVVASFVEPGVSDPGQESTGSTPTSGESVGARCGESSSISRLDASSGRERWVLCGADQRTLRVLGADERFVYAASIDSSGEANVVAIDIATNDERYQIELSATTESQHLDALEAKGTFSAEGVIALNIRRGGRELVIGYDAVTGAEVWVEAADGAVVANSDRVVVLADSSDTLSEAATTRSFTARDRRTGRFMWTVDEPAGLVVASIDDLLVLTDATGTASQPTVAIDVATGRQAWTSTSISGSAVHVGGVVVALPLDGTGSATAGAVDASTGRALWRSSETVPHLGRLIAGGDTVYVTLALELVALDARTGDPRWKTKSSAEPLGVTSDGVIAAVGDALEMLDDSNGSVLWRADIGDPTRVSGVIVTSDAVYVSRG
jgi:outer membrane protein assembly factor BamB